MIFDFRFVSNEDDQRVRIEREQNERGEIVRPQRERGAERVGE
jgi:hypothetical protein